MKPCDRVCVFSGLRWYAIHVRSRHEFSVRDTLNKMGVHVFLPTIEKVRQWKDRKKKVSSPLFPGYLFVGLGSSEAERSAVIKTRGVVRYLGQSSGETEAVPADQINALMRAVESGKDIDPYPYLREGERVRIKSGPLEAVEGILVTRKDTHHLVLSVDILKRAVSIQIDASNVEMI
jgi:transcription termination/antitermination protein NusG